MRFEIVDCGLLLADHDGAGNSAVVRLSDQPDGTGCFYGRLEIDGDVRGLDVMPPRALWTGDFGDEAADAVCWRVLVDGEEVDRAEAIESLSAL